MARTELVGGGGEREMAYRILQAQKGIKPVLFQGGTMRAAHGLAWVTEYYIPL